MSNIHYSQYYPPRNSQITNTDVPLISIGAFFGLIICASILEYIIKKCRSNETRAEESEATVLSNDDISDKNEASYDQV